MPLYKSVCEFCGKETEEFRRMADCDELPVCCGRPNRWSFYVPMISADITPYQAVAVDSKSGKAPFITSRKEHKEFLKRNHYHEVETSTVRKPEIRGDFDLKKDLIQAVKQVTGH